VIFANGLMETASPVRTPVRTSHVQTIPRQHSPPPPNRPAPLPPAAVVSNHHDEERDQSSSESLIAVIESELETLMKQKLWWKSKRKEDLDERVKRDYQEWKRSTTKRVMELSTQLAQLQATS
jgi:hypothetical protein